MTEVFLSRTSQRVETPEAARFLTDAKVSHYLQPFLGQEMSVGEAARHVGATVQVMHYWVGRLVDLGLLHVTRNKPRQGRAIKYYRAVADGFFVLYTASPYETPEAWLVADYAERERQLARARCVRGWRGAKHRARRRLANACSNVPTASWRPTLPSPSR